MVDPATIATGLGQAKQAFDLLRTASDMLNKSKPDLAAIKEHMHQTEQAVLQFQQTVYELQKDNLELQAKNHQLQTRLDSEDRWERTKALYELKEIYSGTCVYVPKDGSTRRVCPNCFESDRKEMTLQGGGGGDPYLSCVACKTSYQVAYLELPRSAITD